MTAVSHATCLPSSSRPFRGDFQGPPSTTHRVAAHPPAPTCRDRSGSTRCWMLGRPPGPLCQALASHFLLLPSLLKGAWTPHTEQKCRGARERKATGQTKFISSASVYPGGDACLCGQNPLLSAYYSSGKSDSLLLPNCGWKSSVLGAEKDALLQNCPLAS